VLGQALGSNGEDSHPRDLLVVLQPTGPPGTGRKPG